MLYTFINTYTIVFVSFLILVILDWALGIDKLNPYLEKKLSTFTNEAGEFFFPTVGLTVLGLFSLLLYFCTGFIFFHMIYFFAVFSGLVLLAVVIAVWAIFKVLLSIRNFIISKKKP